MPSPFPPNTQLDLWYDWASTLGAADSAEFLARVAPLTPAHWAEFWPFVTAHGLAPWFHTHFAAITAHSKFKIQNSKLPRSAHSPLTHILQNHYLHNAIANIRAFHELAEILDRTNAIGLPVILLKGIHLANCIYPDPAERVMADADILVHPADLPTMHRIMITHGYSTSEEAAKHPFHLAYRHAEKKHVEVHHGLWDDTQLLGLDNFWQHATPFQLEGRQALALSSADAFLHISMHAAHNHCMWRSLRPLLDMLFLTRTNWQPDDWAKLRQEALKIGFVDRLPRLLCLTEQLLNTKFPGEREGLEASPLDPQLLRDGCRRALAASDTGLDSSTFARFVRTSSASERWAMLRSRLFPTSGTVAKACGIPNTPRVWLHYPSYIFARTRRMFMLLMAVLLPKQRNARLTEFDSEHENYAFWGSLKVPDKR